VIVIVPDASVLLKWALPADDEPDFNAAIALRNAALERRALLKLPSLWLYEVGNTLARRLPDQCKELLEVLIAFELEESVFTDEWLDHALALTEAYGVTFYDAAYHAVAMVEKGLFVTADGKYVQKAGNAGSVVVLRDWRIPFGKNN